MELGEEFRIQRGQLFVELVDQDVKDSWGRYDQVRESRALYYGTATQGMPLPWPGASNIHLPVMQEKVETLVPMVMAAFWGVDPVVNVERSPDEYSPEQTDDVETFQNFVVTKDIPNLHETTECWVRNMGLDGMSVIKVYWERKHRDVSQTHTLKALYDADQMTAAGVPAPEARPKSAVELLVDIFGPIEAPTGLIDAMQVGGSAEPDAVAVGTEWLVDFLEDRIMYRAYVKFQPGIRIDEVRATVRRRVLERDGACVDVLEFEDLIVPYRTADLQTADRVTQRYWVTIEEVEEKARSGEWVLTDADLATLRGRSSREEISDNTDPQLQTQKDSVVGEITGIKSEKRSNDKKFPLYDKNKIHVYMVHTQDVVEEGGPRTEVIYHIPCALRKVVRAEYLDEVYPHGRRPFICAKYLPMSDRWAALGIGDQLSAINLEINAIINFINNNQELINNPFFFYEGTALNSDSEGLKLRPGQGVPVLSVQGIMFPSFPQQPLANMQELSTLLMFGDRVTLSPLNAGSSQMKNAPQTARGTLALLGEGHIKTDMLITRLQRGPWTELMEQIFGLYQEFMPDEKWYYIVRDSSRRPNRVTKSMMRGRFEFTFKGNTVNTNREVMRSMAQVRYNMVMTHPDYATDPNVRREALRDLLKWWGDGVDISRLLPALPGQGAYTHPPMTQAQENKILEMGMPVQVLPTDPHPDHLQDMDRFEKTSEFERMPSHAVGLWANHKVQHMEQLRAQMAQSTLPAGGTAGNNVPVQGMTLAGGGNELGQLEGGNAR